MARPGVMYKPCFCQKYPIECRIKGWILYNTVKYHPPPIQIYNLPPQYLKPHPLSSRQKALMNEF